jgi:energy-coupling factor transporter ATP-binding protein EcfA2
MISSHNFEDQGNWEWMTDLLIRQCLSNPNILHIAYSCINSVDLRNIFKTLSGERLLAFSALVLCWQDNKSIPSDDIFIKACIDSFLKAVSNPAPDAREVWEKKMEAYLKDIIRSKPINEEDASLTISIIKYIEYESRIKPRERQLIEDAYKTGNVKGLAEELAKLKTQQMEIREPLSLFANDGESTGGVIPTGVSWFDNIVSSEEQETRGLYRGDAYIIFGETGGGKSTLCNQLACSLGLTGHKVAVCTTEEKVNKFGSVCKRFACVTGLPVDAFGKYRCVENFPADLITADKKEALALIEKNVKGIDYAVRPGDIKELGLYIAVHKPDVLFLDWIGKLGDAMMVEGASSMAGSKHDAYRYIADQMVSLSVQFSIPVVMFHQLAAAESKSLGPTGNFNHTQGQDCKSICNNAGFGIVMSPKDAGSIVKLTCTKSRFAQSGQSVFCHLDGRYGVFRKCTASYRKGNNRNWDSGEEHTIPTNNNGDS